MRVVVIDPNLVSLACPGYNRNPRGCNSFKEGSAFDPGFLSLFFQKKKYPFAANGRVCLTKCWNSKILPLDSDSSTSKLSIRKVGIFKF